MSLPLISHPDVQEEIDEAYRWHEQLRTPRGDDFLAAIDEVYRRLEQMPLMHQVIWQDVRRRYCASSLTASSIASMSITSS